MPDNNLLGDPNYAGRVRPGGAHRLPRSSLVTQFKDDIGQAAEAIILRGYAGKTTYVDRALEFIKIAARNKAPAAGQDEEAPEPDPEAPAAGQDEEAPEPDPEAPAELAEGDRAALAGIARRLADGGPVAPAGIVEMLAEMNPDALARIAQLFVAANPVAMVKGLRTFEQANLVRVYLTLRLDRYVDFDRSCLLAWRYETKADLQDMVTVWLRRYDKDNIPITYRAIDEAVIGAAPSTYLGGDLLDDYLRQAGSQAGAWGSQAGGNLGNKPWTHGGCSG